MCTNSLSESSDRCISPAAILASGQKTPFPMLQTVLGLGLAALLLSSTGCDRIQSVADAAVSKSNALTSVSAEELISELEDSENELDKLFRNIRRGNSEETLEFAVALINHVRGAYAQLGLAAEVSPEQERAAQMISLRCHYIASQMLPQLRESVATQAEQVIALRPETSDAQIATVLKFCADIDPEKKVQPQTLQTLKSVSQSFDRPRHGVALYSAVAQEYWKNGQCESAEKVLKTGIKTFEHRQEKISLVHQMIDQGHRDPPNTGRICQEAFKRSENALASAYSGGQTRTVKFRS